MIIIVIGKKRSFFVNKYYYMGLVCLSVCVVNGMEKDITQKKDWNAKKYEKDSQLQYNAALRLLSTIEFKGHERVLDIGCGDGRVTEAIAHKVPQGSVKGIDISPNMIQHARETHNVDNLTFDMKDITKSKYHYELAQQFGPDKYDYIIGCSSLSWIKDQSQLYTNIAALLAHKGKLVAGLAHEDSSYLRARYAMHTHDTWKNYFVGYEMPYYPSNEEKMKSLLKNAGFAHITVRKGGAPRTFANREEFIAWMRAIPAQIDQIPEERHTEFLNDIVDEYLKEVPQKEDGSIEVTIAALVVMAEKSFDLSWLVAGDC